MGAIERISKDLQELIQKDAGAEEEDEADEDLAPGTTNGDTVELSPAATSSMGTPWSWLRGIPEEEESSMKDSVTSGIPLRPPISSAEASGSGEPLIPSSKVFVHGGEDTVIKTKTALAASKTEEKGGCLWVTWYHPDGSRKVTRSLLKNQCRWWANLRERRRPLHGVSYPSLLGLAK